MLNTEGRRRSKMGGEAELCFYGTVRRACDSCRARKIRCDGRQPCNRCYRSSSECSFLDVPKRRAPRRRQPDSPASEVELGLHSPKKKGLSPRPLEPSPPAGLLYNPPDFVAGAHEQYDLDAMLLSPGEGRAGSPPGIRETAAAPREGPADLPTHRAETIMPVVSGGTNLYFNSQSKVSSTSLPPRAFLPLVQVFFDQLFPIMPVLDRNVYLNSDLLRGDAPLSSEDYCMLAAATALTAVQLSLAADFIQQDFPTLSAELLVEECLRERRQSDYIETPGVSTVLTSFFLFGYYGNLERHNQARHYLHEAISFAESIGIDDEGWLSQLSPEQGQRSRIIFWLLFVTERAYALQRATHVKIRTTSVKLPSIFESDDPRLLYGFVSLVNVFLVIDSTFLSVWSGTSKRGSLSKAWLIEVLRKLKTPATTLAESLEKHRLDVSISQHWLQMLLWKIGAKEGLLTLTPTDEHFNLQFPIQLARDVVRCTSLASQASLDSHGIGMEQKLADIASGLADVLKCAQGDDSEPFRQGRGYLMALLVRLSQIRGAPSHYLQPLLDKLDVTACQIISPLPLSAGSRSIQADNYENSVNSENDGEWSRFLE